MNNEKVIEAKDLRAGNWVKYILTDGNPEDRQITGIFHDLDGFDGYAVQFDKAERCIIDEDCIEPIPLDEGWLIRAGYALVLDEGDKKYYQNPDEQSGFGVLFDHHEIAFYQFTSFAVVILIHDEPYFQYVHHWQNITYALTGTELEFKPK